VSVTELYIDRPKDVHLKLQRNTTPRVTLKLYEDEAMETEIDVETLTFEAHFAKDHDADPALSFVDADFEKNPEVGDTNVLVIPIEQTDTEDSDVLFDVGFWEVFMTDGAGHRKRLIRGPYTMES
jgi:hypothetical protein